MQHPHLSHSIPVPETVPGGPPTDRKLSRDKIDVHCPGINSAGFWVPGHHHPSDYLEIVPQGSQHVPDPSTCPQAQETPQASGKTTKLVRPSPLTNARGYTC